MDALAAVEDLAVRWRPLDPAETATAAALLGDASALLRARVPSVDAHLGAGTLDGAVVVHVVCEMVRRAMLARDGVVSETIDDYTYRRADPTGGRLDVLPEELALLAPAGVGGGGAWTVTPAWAP